MAMGMKKASLGRQKIKIAKIERKSHLQVTFSKRRSGLFKKASELCILCGVEIVIIVFSPAGKVFSFGHPHVESIIDRFLSKKNNNKYSNNNNICMSNTYLHHQQPDTKVIDLLGVHRHASVQEMNMTLTQIITELEVEKKREEMLGKMRRESQNQFWWEAPISVLNIEQLGQLRNAMDELGNVVTAQIADIVDGTSKLLAMRNTMILDEFGAIDTKPQGMMVNNHNNHSTYNSILDRFDGSIYT